MKIPKTFRDSRIPNRIYLGTGVRALLMFLAASVYVLGENPSEPDEALIRNTHQRG